MLNSKLKNKSNCVPAYLTRCDNAGQASEIWVKRFQWAAISRDISDILWKCIAMCAHGLLRYLLHEFYSLTHSPTNFPRALPKSIAHECLSC